MKPILLTPGEPAGIGPDVALVAAAQAPELILVADPELLRRRAEALGQAVEIQTWKPGQETPRAGLAVLPVALERPEQPGRLDPRNAGYVLACLARAVDLISAGQARALVTGPVHKAVINDAGIAFSGHTEWLAARAGADRVVMLLVAQRLRVALATTHLPLSRVADAIRAPDLTRTLEVLDQGLRQRFGLPAPRIAVLGLNPHAGEGGHLGDEEQRIIAPVIAELRRRGLNLSGPLPADTAFLPDRLEQFDAVLAMYHDQGLPVLKYAGFGQAVNVTLGLPFVRTSVDHGTALDLAGSGQADSGSLQAAIQLARELAS